jgi:hypothetical protein
MPTKSFFVVCILCVALLAGCSKSSPTSNGAAKDNSSAANANATPVNREKVGIAECDDFIAKYESCISSSVPEAQKRQHQENIDALRSSWRQLAVSTGAKDTLILMCKRQVAQARESMKDFNCQF